MTDLAKFAQSLTAAQRVRFMEGRVVDCPYDHPDGTRCPSCAKWPYVKGEAADFAANVRSYLKGQEYVRHLSP
jgi:hypothetical protein